MPLVLAGATSGSTTIQATDAVTATLTLPSTTGTIGLYAAPQVTAYTSGSGTYTVPTGAKWLYIKMIGGGGGGGGGGSTNGGAGGAGGSTTFGSSLLTCTGGGNAGAQLSLGGTATINSPATGIALAGGLGEGFTAYVANAQSHFGAGGIGGTGPFGGAGAGAANTQGSAAAVNTGAGGGGGGTNSIASLQYTGAGGGSGGYIEAYITSPSSTYAYAIGSGGTAGAAGTGGYVGAAGGSGLIIITAYFG
jgi:hypothetical protein